MNCSHQHSEQQGTRAPAVGERGPHAGGAPTASPGQGQGRIRKEQPSLLQLFSKMAYVFCVFVFCPSVFCKRTRRQRQKLHAYGAGEGPVPLRGLQGGGGSGPSPLPSQSACLLVRTGELTYPPHPGPVRLCILWVLVRDHRPSWLGGYGFAFLSLTSRGFILF